MKITVTIFGEQHTITKKNLAELKEKNIGEVKTGTAMFSICILGMLMCYGFVYAWPNIFTAILCGVSGPITYIVYVFRNYCKCQTAKINDFERIINLVRDRDRIIRDIDKLAKELEKDDE